MSGIGISQAEGLVPDTPQQPPSAYEVDSILSELESISKKLGDSPPASDFSGHGKLKDRKLNLKGVGDTDNQIMMRAAFKNMGRAASLARVLENIAVKNAKNVADNVAKGKSWEHLQGKETRKVMMNIINTIYSGMLEAVISGSMAWRLCNEPDFVRATDVHQAQQLSRQLHPADCYR